MSNLKGGVQPMAEKKLSEELRRCLEDGNCKDCESWNPEIKVTCKGLLQKAYEVVKRYEEMFPCKVGDMVYMVRRGRVLPVEVFEIQIFLLEKELVTQIKCSDNASYGYMHFLTKEIDKTVFLTKEAAEKALKEMEDRRMERLTENFLGNVQLKACGNDSCKETCAEHDGEKSCNNCPIQKAFEKLAEYEDLEEQGRLLKLPRPLGDALDSIPYKGDKLAEMEGKK